MMRKKFAIIASFLFGCVVSLAISLFVILYIDKKGFFFKHRGKYDVYHMLSYYSTGKWSSYWKDVGHGEAIPIDQKRLEIDKKRCLVGLQNMLRNDTRSTSPTRQIDEKTIMPLLPVYFPDQHFYFLAYGELALHAMSRNEKIGRYMYTHIPDNPEVLADLSSRTLLLSWFCKKQWDRAGKVANAILKDNGVPQDLEVDARFVSIASEYHLNPVDACQRISSMDVESIKYSRLKEYVRGLREKCTHPDDSPTTR